MTMGSILRGKGGEVLQMDRWTLIMILSRQIMVKGTLWDVVRSLMNRMVVGPS